MKKIREWFSIQLAKHPGRIVIIAILLFNIVFLILSALIISSLSLKGTEGMSFLEAAFYTVTMILDAGCISFVVEDIGTSGVAIAAVCLAIIIIGMVSFTGAVIGYVTNYISGFISSSSSDSRRLKISDHFVILNWNSRASEIVNDLLYCRKKQTVVVLTDGRRNEIQKEIDERLSDTIRKENRALKRQCKEIGGIKGAVAYFKGRVKNNVTVIIREGDVYSSKQLHDIALEQARSVVILGNDINNSVCKYGNKEMKEDASRGNAQTVRTLMQVSDITSAQYSKDNQKIIVEISDDWTWELVGKIIKYKQVAGKCNIVPVRVNQILGQILSQFPLMPELNLAYRELFSNKGATFFLEEKKVDDDNAHITQFLKNHSHAVPLTSMQSGGKDYFFYMADAQKDIAKVDDIPARDYSVKLNRNYWIERKNVIILGHNSKCKDIMQGFCGFCNEWGHGNDKNLRIIVIDDKQSLEKMNYYKDYPFVIETVPASIYDKELICSTIERFVDSNVEDTSVLILSDDSASNENIDAVALANLIYVQDIVSTKKHNDPNFDLGRLDIVVELINPKHHDIVSSYSVNNVVISNRYISKMITQIGEKEAIFDFYTDILTYDAENAVTFMSKEVYAKKVSTFFAELPGECTAAELIRAVWEASVSDDIPKEKQNPTVVLGYVKKSGDIVLFDGDQTTRKVKLESTDKILVFTNH